MAERVAIIGGGITGLAAAWRLEQLTGVEIDLYEATARTGGKLQTVRVEEFLIETGPDSIFTHKGAILDVLEELGLTPKLVEPKRNEFFLLCDGELHRFPRALATFGPKSRDAVCEASFLSDAAKERARQEPSQQICTSVDESIRSFFTRRFGPEFSRHVAEPLLAGTHGGDADRLSMGALYPGYVKRERTHGSLTGGSDAPAGSGAAFVSFESGVNSLPEALASRLRRTRIHLNAELSELPDGDAFILAVPANRAVGLLRPKNHEAADICESILFESSCIVTLAFERSAVDHPLDGTGFLVPNSLGVALRGCTWSSEKWPFRAPDDKVLLRVFRKASNASEEVILRETTEEIRPILKLTGSPILTRVDTWGHALPQYEVGHVQRMDELDAILERTPDVLLAGTSYRGVGIADSVRQGLTAAETLAARL